MCLSRCFAADGAELCLLARNSGRLEQVRVDLLARGAARVDTANFDAAELTAIGDTLDDVWQRMGDFDVAVVCHGTLTDQARAESDVNYAAQEFIVNGASATLLLMALAARFERNARGILVVLGSVAGDRGRPSNALYGAAKSAVATCAEGLHAKLYKVGVTVLTVKPGFVRTAMTADLALPTPLVASAERVGGDIHRAILRGKSGVMYTPWFWRWIMLIIRWIPSTLFKRMSL